MLIKSRRKIDLYNPINDGFTQRFEDEVDVVTITQYPTMRVERLELEAGKEEGGLG